MNKKYLLFLGNHIGTLILGLVAIAMLFVSIIALMCGLAKLVDLEKVYLIQHFVTPMLYTLITVIGGYGIGHLLKQILKEDGEHEQSRRDDSAESPTG